MVERTAVDDMSAIFYASTATKIPIAMKARTDSDIRRTVNGDETKSLVHCKYYHMEVLSRQTIRPAYFGKTFEPNVLPRDDFYGIKHTVIEDLVTLRFPSTAVAVQRPKKNRTEYECACQDATVV